MRNGFALSHDKILQIYFFCVKRQAKIVFLKDVESIVGIFIIIQQCSLRGCIQRFNCNYLLTNREELKQMNHFGTVSGKSSGGWNYFFFSIETSPLILM